MGICCSTNTKSYIHCIINKLSSLNISQQQFPLIKTHIYNNNTINNIDCTENNTHQNHFISKDQFIEISTNNFYNPSNPFHSHLFSLIADNSNQKRSFVYFYMIFLSHSSPDDKLNEFIESIFVLEDRKCIKYIEFKQLLIHFIHCALILPIQSYKETIAINKKKEMNAINKDLREFYNEYNVNRFVDWLCERFESMKIGERDDNEDECTEKIMVYPNNVAEDIFGEKKNLCFDWALLNEIFSKKYGIEEYSN